MERNTLLKNPTPVLSSSPQNDVDSSPVLSAEPLTRQDLATLKSAFPRNRLGVKVQCYNRERTRAMPCTCGYATTPIGLGKDQLRAKKIFLPANPTHLPPLSRQPASREM